MDFSQMMSYHALFPHPILFRKNSPISKGEKGRQEDWIWAKHNYMFIILTPTLNHWVILSVRLRAHPLLLSVRVLLSPVPGQQCVMEVPLPRNIDTQKRVRTSHAKPLSDEAMYILGSSLIYIQNRLRQLIMWTFKTEKQVSLHAFMTITTKCSLLLWRGEEEDFFSLDI